MSKSPMDMEDQQLKMKFRSLTYTAPKREQKVRDVNPEQREKMHQTSYQIWKKLNPGYFEDEYQTTTRAMQQYDERDFQIANKEKFRVKDKHTEYVEYVVRDKALSRSKGGK